MSGQLVNGSVMSARTETEDGEVALVAIALY